MPIDIIKAAGEVTTQFQCWFGLSELPACSYNPQTPQIYFSLGDAVAALGLMFAAYQLRRPSWEIILKIRGIWQRNIFWALAWLGVLAILVAALTPQMTPQLRPPFNYPLFYELIGFLFFLGAPFTLIILATRSKNLFKANRAERFYQIVLGEIARPTPDTLASCIDIIGSNLPALCDAVDELERHRFFKEKRPNPELEYLVYANSIFSVVLSEPRVVEYIVTARLGFLIKFIGLVKEKGISNAVNFPLQKLVHALFENTQSHFYTQLDYAGFSLAGSIFEDIFEDPGILDSARPLQEWSSQLNPANPRHLAVYLHALEIAVKARWNNRDKVYHNSPYWVAFDNLKHFAHNAVYEINRGDESAMEYFSSISHFLGWTIPWAYREARKQKRVNGGEEKVICSGRPFDVNLISLYAHALYEFLETLSMVRSKHDERLRLAAIFATQEVLGVTANDNDDFEGVRNCLLRYMWEKVETNVQDGYYPPILRIYLLLMGGKFGELKGWKRLERNKLIIFLEKSLKPKILKNARMVNGARMEEVLLPGSIKLNRRTGKFVYFLAHGKRQIMTVERPSPQKPVLAVEATQAQQAS